MAWYQFSLRSLLLFVLFVAVLCSIGVCTHWLVSAFIAMTVTVGGSAGWIVARTRSGFVQGVVIAVQFFLIVILVSVFIWFPFRFFPSNFEDIWRSGVVLGIVVLIGGLLGGFTVRPRTGRTSHDDSQRS
jgi:hypothetical protein